MADVYQKLRERLDDMAVGYPATENGIEIKILKRLFTDEQAELFLGLSPLLETPADAAKRLKRNPDELAQQMEQMAQKGLLFRKRKGELVRYAAVPYVVGIFEHQLKRMDEDFARDHEKYFETAFGRSVQSFKTPVLRTIPINRQLVADYPVAPYEDVLEIIEKQEKIAIAPCVCRTTTKLAGKECDKPLENCFSFGSHAEYYVENRMGRYITRAEAKEIISNNDKAGLVMQPFNSQKIGGMCSCCGDCCGVLRSLKMHPNPAELVQSNYFARVDEEECTGCETCLERCQMGAIEIIDEIASISLNRCIGCGLCVTTCPSEAMQLMQKPRDQQYMPPETGMHTYIRIAEERQKNPLPG
ncbi:MAG: 4Fe-4S binding protein [Desulfobacterales bacterium]|jgi:ferredoxin